MKLLNYLEFINEGLITTQPSENLKILEREK